MGIDYFIVNHTNKEYVWTARLNPVYDWDNLSKPITNKMLEEGLAMHYLDDIQWVEKDEETDILSIKEFHRYLRYYKLVRDYVKKCNCTVEADISDNIPEDYINNIRVENSILSEPHSIRDLCDLMR